jgi:hypothetical protein
MLTNVEVQMSMEQVRTKAVYGLPANGPSINPSGAESQVTPRFDYTMHVRETM